MTNFRTEKEFIGWQHIIIIFEQLVYAHPSISERVYLRGDETRGHRASEYHVHDAL